VERATPVSASKLKRARFSIMFEMEKLLMLFTDNKVQCCILISWAIIQQKAISLQDKLKKMPSESNAEHFTGSKGLFKSIKKHAYLHNISLHWVCHCQQRKHKF
jgi:hypothetical protein